MKGKPSRAERTLMAECGNGKMELRLLGIVANSIAVRIKRTETHLDEIFRRHLKLDDLVR